MPDKTQKFIMIVGLPGSGKSTLAREVSEKQNAIVHSSDDLREELFGDESDCDNNDVLFPELHRRIKSDLENGRSIIYDATNVSFKSRMAVLNQYKKMSLYKQCYLMATPYDVCFEQNSKRDRNVPDFVIKKMYKCFFVPEFYEGWDDINIVWNFDKDKYDMGELMTRLSGITQDNPHHTLTVGEHCMKCEESIKVLTDDKHLHMAAKLHDIGKEFTKAFKNRKSEETEIAHFYQHQNVSAYDSLFYLKAAGYDDSEILKICNYIQWHMQPYDLVSSKAKKKFIKLVGEEVYDAIMLLNQGDRAAK